MGKQTEPWSERLKAARKALHDSQKQAAQKMGVTENTVRRWEHSRTRPRGLSIVALKRYIKSAPPAPSAGDDNGH